MLHASQTSQDFTLLVEQESLGYVSPAEEAAIIDAACMRFAAPRLQEHLARRSVEAPPSRALKPHAELLAWHEPTVWSSFQVAYLPGGEGLSPSDPTPSRSS